MPGSASPRQRTGFAPFDTFLSTLEYARELPGYYPEELTAKARKRALRNVNRGWLREAAILTREACTEWGDCFGVLGTITENLLGAPPERQRWQGPESLVAALRGTPSAPGLADVLIPESEISAVMRVGLTLGVGLGRLERVTVRGRVMRRLSHWDSEHLRYDWAEDIWHVSTSRGDEWRAVEDGEWVLYLPYGAKFPWKRAPWKAITLAYTLARDGWFQRSRYAQRVAPVNVGMANESSTKEQREKFLALLDGAQFDTSIVLRPGETYEKKGVTGGDNTVAVFEQIDAWARRTMITCLKGETATTDGGKGFASDATQASMSAAKRAWIARTVRDFEGPIFSWASHDLTGEHAEVSRLYDTTTPADALTQIEALNKAGDMLMAVTGGLKALELEPVRESVQRMFSALGLDVRALPADAEVVPDLTLNGAQIAQATAIVVAVAAGEMPRDAGIGQLKNLFNLSDQQAASIMGSVGHGFVSTAEAA